MSTTKIILTGDGGKDVHILMQINNLDHKCLRAGHNFQQNMNYLQDAMVSLDRYLVST